MPIDRISGADADRYGSETARKIAKAIGATSISEISNEFELNNRKITIRCARKGNTQFGVPYQILNRVNAVMAALEQENGNYKLYEISPEKFKQHMRPTASKGSSAGRVGIAGKNLFINEGKFVQLVKLETEEKTIKGNKIWRMAFRCGNQGSSLWGKCKNFNVAAITYEPLERFDLTNHKYNEPHSLWSKLSPAQKASLRHVAYDMKNGDIIYVKEGTQIICKGTVLGKPDRAYVFDEKFRIIDPNGTPWPHQVPVAWDMTFKSINILLGAEQNAVLELNGDRLERLQKALSSTAAEVKDKIARICWNDYRWQRPSGRDGKSKNKDAYEYKVGYGHEEWLLDTTKVIDGYHYGYLQPIADGWEKHQRMVLNISLYSINDDTSEWWWIGTIHNAQVVSSGESKVIYAYYKEKGWFREMIEQIRDVKGVEKDFLDNAPRALVNVKFLPEDWDPVDPPQKILNAHVVIPAAYYKLLDKIKEPHLELPFGEDPDFTAGHTSRKGRSIVHYGARTNEIRRIEGEMSDNVYKQLVKLYGSENVKQERSIGIGSRVDISVRDKDGEIFFELKADNSIRTCIREALSQLLEYCYYPNKKRAKRLIIVSPNPINQQAKDYLNKIKEEFKIPVYYQRYNVVSNCLESEEF